MKTMRLVVATAFALGMWLSALAQGRTVHEIEKWQFRRDTLAAWQNVTVPHDWAINGPFDRRNDMQTVQIVQNGETEASEKTGRTGALPWVGKGYYKTTITVDNDVESAELLFDGAMAEPHVYVNGKLAGYWAYGYNAFRVDVSKYLHKGTNEVEVRLENLEESSRWYPGGGLYRPVKLIVTPKAHIDLWGGYFRTQSATAKQAVAAVASKAISSAKGAVVSVTLLDAAGRTVAKASGKPDAEGMVISNLKIATPKLWSPESPYLYTLVTTLTQGKQVVDETRRKVGIRTIKVSAEGGFQLNGVSRKIQGVCLHHDLGPLGAAENRSAIEHRVRVLKDMGADAIRTSHNMPSTMMMEVCDSMGMMVMAESFDMWVYPKCKNGYARLFNDWAERDIENLILNHRDHPSIVMWSIGNEIPEQWSEEGLAISKRLQDLCHKFDPTRPVTQGLDHPDEATKSGVAKVMDVPGFNYRLHKYDNNFPQLPQGFLLGSETASTMSSRGVYKFPVEPVVDKRYADGQCSAYDTEYGSWSELPDDDWVMMEDRPWTIGEFVWTGYDYLGEPTPYDEFWPSRSSYFGIIDLAGIPKDRYWLYRAHWNKKESTLHMLPHWTWPGREGQVTPVYVYTSWPQAELFVNGKSQGRRTFDKSGRLDRYRLRWNEVVYEPGEIKVVAFDADGRAVDSTVTRTAGAPHHLVLSVDRKQIAGTGQDLAYVTVTAVDKDGNVCPDAANNILLTVSGAGSLRASCNGDATSVVPFNEPLMPLFAGKLMTIVEGKGSGTAVLHANTQGLPEATIEIQVK